MYMYQLRLRLRTANSVHRMLVVVMKFLVGVTKDPVVFLLTDLRILTREIAKIVHSVLLSGALLNGIEVADLYRYSCIADRGFPILDDKLNLRSIRSDFCLQLAL